MGKINLLDKNVSELIAAGEVVERPASIVKELLENSIDAGAKSVTIEIKNGGISYIRVTDDGIGFLKEDLPKAFLRHSTSKISNEDDLNRINTLGFRGEALASIIVVSRVEVLSKSIEEFEGNRIVFEGNQQVEFMSAGCPNGTTIIVRDLFYNVPARLKFLKKASTEASVISNIVDKIALSHPEISFKYIKDNKEVLHTPGDTKLISTIYSVLGKDFANNSIFVDYIFENIKINGYISSPDYFKSNKNIQHFFINKRYIKSKICSLSLEEGYKENISQNKFPLAVINIDIDPSKIDINVHPSKIEVKFDDEKPIYNAIYFAVKNSIKQYNDYLNNDNINYNIVFDEKLLKNDDLNSNKSIQYDSNSCDNLSNDKVDIYNNIDISDCNISYQNSNFLIEYSCNNTIKPMNVDIEVDDEAYEDLTLVSENKNTSPQNICPLEEDKKLDYFNNIECEILKPLIDSNINIIGELFKTYILVEYCEDFFIIDKHAAHERIIQKNLKKNLGNIERQHLLSPVSLLVSREEHRIALENEDIFNKLGFCVEDFGQSYIIIREAPFVLEDYDIESTFVEVINYIKEFKNDLTPSLLEERLHSIACRSAIKANDNNSEQELLELVNNVLNDTDIRNCPHGRPIIINFSKFKIEKMFRRRK